MKRIFILAGEASGDLHAAELIKASLKINPQLQFFGMGGEKMRAAGAKIIVDNKDMSVIGIFELLRHAGVIYKAVRIIKKVIKHDKPDLVIFVDYPAMNLRLAKKTFRKNLKSLYFISPQIWAWKQKRIEIVKKCIDQLAVIFPFEVAFYQKHQVPAKYVGNPLVHEVKPTLSKEKCYDLFNLDSSKPVVALLPGSRGSEIKFNFETILQTAKKIQQSQPNTQFIIPLAAHFDETPLREQISTYSLDIKLIKNQLYNILQISDAALSVSGTVTLEVALMGTPFAIMYKLNELTFRIAKKLVKIETIGLCNLVAGKMIAKEFIQSDANAENLSKEVLKLMHDKTYRQQHILDFQNLRQAFIQYPQEDIGELVNLMVCS